MLYLFVKQISRFQKSLYHFRRRGIRWSFSDMRHDEKGVAAIEFALIAPLLAGILLGFFAAYDGMGGSRSVEQSATVVVDLVTRQNEMNDDKFNLYLATTQSLLGKYATGSDFTFVVTSVKNEFDSEGDPTLTVAWSKSNIESKELTNEDLANYKIPSIPEGGSVVLLNIGIEYTPLITSKDFSVFEFSRSVTRRPRFVDQIPYTMGN